MENNGTDSDTALDVFAECSSIEEFKLKMHAAGTDVRFSPSDFHEMLDMVCVSPHLVKILADTVADTDMLDSVVRPFYDIDFSIAAAGGADPDAVSYARFPALTAFSDIDVISYWRRSDLSDAERRERETEYGRLVSAIMRKISDAGYASSPCVVAFEKGLMPS